MKKTLEDGIPAWAYLIDVKVDQVELGEFDIDHEWSLHGLLQSQKGRSMIGNGLGFLHRFRHLEPGTFAPPPRRRGIVRYKVGAVRFGRSLPRASLQWWANHNKKIMAGSREGIIVALALSPLKFAKVLPLAMIGEIVYDHQEYSYAAKFFEDNGCLTLDVLRFDEHQNGPLFSPQWHFLMLEEIPEAA